MKTTAFTIIELIFVIVILGILGAIAIPKLSATRDDAKVASLSHAIATAATEIAAYAVAKGTIENNISLMSRMVAQLEGRGDALVDISVPSVDFRMGTVSDCITLEIADGTQDANLSVVYGAAGGDSLCVKLQQLFNASQYPIPLTGKRVHYAY